MEEIHVEDYNPYDDDDGEIVLNVQITWSFYILHVINIMI